MRFWKVKEGEYINMVFSLPGVGFIGGRGCVSELVTVSAGWRQGRNCGNVRDKDKGEMM